MKLFRSICERLLYAHITTDWLDKLLENADQPWRQRLFQHTRSLRIEYGDRDRESYRLIMARGAEFWDYWGQTADEAELTEMKECRAEMENLTEALTKANKVGTQKLFPRLETIAVSSVYGKGTDVWQRYEDFLDELELRTNIERCCEQFTTFCTSGNVRHICLEQMVSSLYVYWRNVSFPIDHTMSTTEHSVNVDTYFSLWPGLPLRWVCTMPPTSDFVAGIRLVTKALEYILRHRDLAPPSQCRGKPPVTLDIYYSTPTVPRTSSKKLGPKLYDFGVLGRITFPPNSPRRSLTLEEQRTITAELGANAQTLFRSSKNGHPADQIRWYPSGDAPLCDACGIDSWSRQDQVEWWGEGTV